MPDETSGTHDAAPFGRVRQPEPSMPTSIHVIPLKNGLWRIARMTAKRAAIWDKAYRAWWNRKGHRLAISPEMWRES